MVVQGFNVQVVTTLYPTALQEHAVWEGKFQFLFSYCYYLFYSFVLCVLGNFNKIINVCIYCSDLSENRLETIRSSFFRYLPNLEAL